MIVNAQMARKAALLLAVGAVAFFVIVPAYGSSDGRSLRLLSVAPRAALVLLVPIVLALLPSLRQPRRLRRVTTAVSAVLLAAFAILGSASIGLFFMPSALVLAVAAALPDSAPSAS